MPQLHGLVDGLNPVGFTLDLRHAQLLSGDPVQFFHALGPERIRAAHVHDNDGTADDHLPPGQGMIDWRAFLFAYLRHGCGFPLFLELADGESDFVSGRDFLSRVWSEVVEAWLGYHSGHDPGDQGFPVHCIPGTQRLVALPAFRGNESCISWLSAERMPGARGVRSSPVDARQGAPPLPTDR